MCYSPRLVSWPWGRAGGPKQGHSSTRNGSTRRRSGTRSYGRGKSTSTRGCMSWGSGLDPGLGGTTMTEDTPVDMTLEDLRDEIRCVMLGEQSMPKREGETLSNQALTVLHALEERVTDTVRELVQRCGMTTEVVSRALGQLYRLGRIRIERQAGQMRPVVVQPVGLSTGGRE